MRIIPHAVSQQRVTLVEERRQLFSVSGLCKVLRKNWKGETMRRLCHRRVRSLDFFSFCSPSQTYVKKVRFNIIEIFTAVSENANITHHFCFSHTRESKKEWIEPNASKSFLEHVFAAYRK